MFGRYVRIRYPLDTINHLELCEVQVQGKYFHLIRNKSKYQTLKEFVLVTDSVRIKSVFILLLENILKNIRLCKNYTKVTRGAHSERRELPRELSPHSEMQ